MEKTEILYLFLITICALSSFFNKIARKEHLWIYFVTVFIVEFYGSFLEQENSLHIYKYAILIYNIYLGFYFFYKKNCRNLVFKIITLFSIVAFIYDIGFSKVYFDKFISSFMIFLYLFFSFSYFISEIRKPDLIELYKKQKFWISSGLAVWSLMFAFNILPIYFFANSDFVFGEIINNVFHYVTIFTYLLYLIALNCKFK